MESHPGVHRFLDLLKAEHEESLAMLSESPVVEQLGKATAGLPALLKIALQNEIEHLEISAAWAASAPEPEVKLAFARHAGDEARHYQLLEEKMRAMGVDLSRFRPLDHPSPLLSYLRSLHSAPERVAAVLVTCKTVGTRLNVQFLKYLEAIGVRELASLFRQTIIPDGHRYVAVGWDLLPRVAVAPADQQRARLASRRVLNICEEFRSLARLRTGAPVVPGA